MINHTTALMTEDAIRLAGTVSDVGKRVHDLNKRGVEYGVGTHKDFVSGSLLPMFDLVDDMGIRSRYVTVAQGDITVGETHLVSVPGSEHSFIQLGRALVLTALYKLDPLSDGYNDLMVGGYAQYTLQGFSGGRRVNKFRDVEMQHYESGYTKVSVDKGFCVYADIVEMSGYTTEPHPIVGRTKRISRSRGLTEGVNKYQFLCWLLDDNVNLSIYASNQDAARYLIQTGFRLELLKLTGNSKRFGINEL